MDARHRIEALLDNEIALAEQLARTLDSERSALTGGTPEAVRELAAAKVDLLTRLEALERTRRELCAAGGISLPPAASATSLTDGVTSRWRSLMGLMAKARTANEVNGYIINVRRNQVQQLFDVVRGTKPLTYGPGGKVFPKALRELARA